ncbi:hypothetical protein D3C71_1903020 [compost metagenome]
MVPIMSLMAPGSVMPFAAILGSMTCSIHSSGEALNSSPPTRAPGRTCLTVPIFVYSTIFGSTRPRSINWPTARTVVLPW